MKLFLENSDNIYAAQQLFYSLFPAEKLERTEDKRGADIVLKLTEQAGKLTAEAKVRYGGITATARRTGQIRQDDPDPLARGRITGKLLKLAFYAAAVKCLGAEPPWGAITGVRPVKIPTKLLRQGADEKSAQKELEKTYHVAGPQARLAMDCARYTLALDRSLEPRDIALYIGIPFCPTRCAYCSFVSADVGKSFGLLPPFLAALDREIAVTGRALKAQNLRINSVYIGGGTPTTLSPDQLEHLMEQVAAHMDLTRCKEYTVEAGRPDTITAEKMAVLQRCGATRVSVNPQSMEENVLRAMGRSHTPKAILEAYSEARESGISAINMDLIAGLPADSVAGFCRSLDAVLTLNPENITVHTLALKKGSALLLDGTKNPLPTEKMVAEMLGYSSEKLREHGYQPYYLYRQKFMSGGFENVGWTRIGFESVYNVCMMEELCNIVSLGGGGVSKLVNRKTGHIERVANPKYPKEYAENIEKILEQKERMAWPIN
ncbi:MAG: coproporphyrinogen dehydrogenase HemZ [Oscillospiraceae bacterium]